MEAEEEHVVLSLFNTRVKHIQTALKIIMTNFGVELQKIPRIGESAWQVFLSVHASFIQMIKQINLLIPRRANYKLLIKSVGPAASL